MTTIDPLTYLDEVDARAEAATEGPWVPYSTGSSPMDNYVTTPGLDGVAMQYALVWKPGDAKFIAHARQDLPALSKALRDVLAVVEEHERREAHNETVPLNRISDLRPEPSAADYRQAIQAALAANNEGGKK